MYEKSALAYNTKLNSNRGGNLNTSAIRPNYWSIMTCSCNLSSQDSLQWIDFRVWHHTLPQWAANCARFQTVNYVMACHRSDMHNLFLWSSVIVPKVPFLN